MLNWLYTYVKHTRKRRKHSAIAVPGGLIFMAMDRMCQIKSRGQDQFREWCSFPQKSLEVSL